MVSPQNLKQNFSQRQKVCLKQFHADITSSKKLKTCHAFTPHIVLKT